MQGVWTALITPFSDDGKLDLFSFKKILRDQVDAGVTGVIPCGTTGESPTLSEDEKKILIQTCIQELQGSGVRVIAGTGSNDTQKTIEFSRWADQQGVDGVLLVTPYYNKPSPAGLEAHFLAVASKLQCEVVLYNVPGRTGVSLNPETICRLAQHPRITTLKEATGSVALSSEILHQLKVEGLSLDILSGDDATYLPLLSIGAHGVISVASNLFPRALVQMTQLMLQGEVTEAQAIHQRYYPLFRDLFIESNPVPIKAAMATLGWCQNHVRLPLVSLQSHHYNQLLKSIELCGLKKGKPA